jgi:hypothetical protein
MKGTMTEEKLLSAANLEDGFADISIETLNGDQLTVRLKAPRWRRRRELILDFQKSLDPHVFVQECLKDALGDRLDFYLDKLSPESVAKIENYAIALCVGESYQKKMAALGKQVIDQLTSTPNGSELNSLSVGLQVAPPESPDGPGLN